MSKITMLTAYDFNTARALEEAKIDYILVGDSLANVFLGYETTQEVSFEEMMICYQAVRRGAPSSNIIADLPYVSVSKSVEEACVDAIKFYKAGANLVKIESAEAKSLELIKMLTSKGYKVMGHLGYTPQSVEKFNGKPSYVRDRELLLEEADKILEAGVNSFVLEMVPDELAKEITEKVSSQGVFTIGIGAGQGTSGQVLVSDDLLGRFNLFKPKFVKHFANQYEDMLRAFSEYKNAVQTLKFPQLLKKEAV